MKSFMEILNENLKERKKVEKKIIVYLDNNGKVVPKEEATKVIITEYDKDGNIINEIFGECNNINKDEGEER